ncbi:MAG: hypothetical protein AAB893_00880 [Patescibacteria group bacterium]
MKSVFQNIWLKDDNVVAVTPFLLNYQGDPFLGFSWRKLNLPDYYQIYNTIKDISKVSGMPELETKFELLSVLPTKLIVSSEYTFTFRVKNTGRSVWSSNEGFAFALSSADNFQYHFATVTNVEPLEERNIVLFLKTPDAIGKRTLYFSAVNNKILASNTYEWNLVELPVIPMTVQYSLLFSRGDKKADMQVELYDKSERLVFKRSTISGSNGIVFVQDVKNVVIGDNYRVVLLKPGFLPRQSFATLNNRNTTVQLKYMLPLDWNRDGAWNIKDLFWFL